MRNPIFAALALLLFAVLGTSCAKTDAWQSPGIVTIESSKDVNSVLPNPWHWYADAHAMGRKALLLRDGDYLGMDEGLVFRYKSSDGSSLKLAHDGGTVKLGNVVVAVSVTESDGLAWLEKASNEELAALRTAGLTEDLGEAEIAAFKRLAAVNPNVDIVFDADSGDLAGAAAILPLFRPRLVPVNPELALLVANRPEIETVVIEAGEAGDLNVLGQLPGLRRLMIGFDDCALEQTGPLPAGLDGLRSLSILCDVEDLSLIAAAPAELEELVVIADSLSNIKGIERFKKLHTVLLLGGTRDRTIDLAPLSQLKELRRVTLPEGTTDAQFATFIADHPNLAVLEILKNDTLTSLQPLAGLKKLEAIIITGDRKDLGPLSEMKSLRFVGLSERTRSAAGEAQVEALEKALPEALIVAIKPFCLGSGWIFALVPVLFLAWFVRHRRRFQSS